MAEDDAAAVAAAALNTRAAPGRRSDAEPAGQGTAPSWSAVADSQAGVPSARSGEPFSAAAAALRLPTKLGAATSALAFVPRQAARRPPSALQQQAAKRAGSTASSDISREADRNGQYVHM